MPEASTGTPRTVDDATLLALLLDASPVGFALYDVRGRYLVVNQSLAAANGLPAADHVGRTPRDVVPGLAAQIEQRIAEVLASGRPVLDVDVHGASASPTNPSPTAGTEWTTGWYPVRRAGEATVLGVAVMATDITRVTALRSTALTLQRALLPTDLPSTAELEVAVRYVAGAADTDVGGDWYDVVALGAGRLAVVIGDVMGRGVAAATVMGQLRTAARTCARLDLQPVEVLDALDALVCDLDTEQIATCLYGVFDPHTRELLLASAGHVPPVLRTPSGGVEVLALEVSAPLGLTDPTRQTSVTMPAGAVLALYTDGLVERRGSDLGTRLDQLAAVLAAGPASLEALADHIMTEMTGGLSDDDVALLLVRVPEDVDQRSRTVLLEVPRDRAVLHELRSRAREVMRSWALLDDVIDDATLLASELATNGLVHGRGRVDLRIRLTRDRLVLEAVDEGRHMPRRRRAGVEDEGGRGLHLVASLAHRWGFRATADGKVVWAELDLAGPGTG